LLPKHEKDSFSRLALFKFGSEWMSSELLSRLISMLDQGSIEHILKGRGGRDGVHGERHRASDGYLVHPDGTRNRKDKRRGEGIKVHQWLQFKGCTATNP